MGSRFYVRPVFSHVSQLLIPSHSLEALTTLALNSITTTPVSLSLNHLLVQLSSSQISILPHS